MIEKLVKYLETRASGSDFKFIVEKAITYMQALDDECQSDRMTCTVRPMCKKRRWLSLLIKAGVPRDLIPQFCYERQIQAVQSFLSKERYFYEPEDCTIYLKDFLEQISQDSSYYLTKLLESEDYDEVSWEIEFFLRKKFNRVRVLNLGESMIAMTDYTLWYFNYPSGYVILNLMDEKIANQELLLALLKFLNRYCKLDVKIYKKTQESWILDLFLFEILKPEFSQKESLKSFLAEEIGKLAEKVKDVNFKIEDKIAHLLINIKAYCGIVETNSLIEPVTFGEINGIYRKLRVFQLNMENWYMEQLEGK
ncbi:MAG: hypothetical protein ACFFCS_20215 [Candidatus Hodarchaeota archaeon]